MQSETVLLATTSFWSRYWKKKERKKPNYSREGWEKGTPPPHRDFKERGVVR